MIIIFFLTSVSAFIYMVISTPVRGLGRFLAPDVMSVMMLGVVFGVRPLFNDRFEDGAWYGLYLPTDEGSTTALWVGFLSMIGLVVGAALSRHSTFSRRLLVRRRTTITRTWFGAWRCLLVTLFSAASYFAALTTFAGAGVFERLSAGRSDETALEGLPEIAMILPLGGSIAATLIFLANRHRRLTLVELLSVLISISVSVSLVSQLGNRRFIIPAVLMPIMASLMKNPVRLKLWHVVVGVVGMLFIAIVPMVRSTGARQAGEGIFAASLRHLQEEGIGGVLKPIFVSYDTEMLDYVAVAAPTFETSSFGWGRGTILEFILRPLPSGASGTEAWSDAILTRLFGGGCGEPFCPVPSYPGLLYFEGGLFVVFVGSLIMGVGLRYLALRWQYNGQLGTFASLSTAILSSFALVAMRTNTVHAAWWAIYTILLGFAIYLIAVRKYRRQRSHGSNSVVGRG